MVDHEYGGTGFLAVDWLIDEGYIRDGDCVMNVACGLGGFASRISRTARIMVCMDTDPEALELTAKACEGGCKVEKYNRDWSEYPPRGGYDACLVSPSALCYDVDALMKMEQVSRRSCMAAFDTGSDLRAMKREVLARAGVAKEGPLYHDPAPLMDRLSDEGREYREMWFSQFSDPGKDLEAYLFRLCRGHGVPDDVMLDLVYDYAEERRGHPRDVNYAVHVVAWDKGE